ncbi:MAG: sugar phosphate isomerase/epimerase [Thermoproteota archaeon]
MLRLENTEENVDTLENAFNRMPGLRFCLDIGHANLFSNNPVDFIDAFSDRPDHIHISDNYGGDSEDDDLHLPPGDGAMDFQQVF